MTNESKVLLTSAARTATVTTGTQIMSKGRGIQVDIDVTAITATPSVVPTIEAIDPVSGTAVTILTGAAITGTGHKRLRVYPGIAAVANEAVNDVVGRLYRVKMTHADADSITYTVGVQELI